MTLIAEVSNRRSVGQVAVEQAPTMAQATSTTGTPPPDNAANTQTWEKSTLTDAQRKRLVKGNQRWKFMVGGLLILGAVAYIVISGTLTNARFFMTVESLMADPERIGETVRVSGAVLGDTIDNTLLVDDVTGDETQQIAFTVVHVPEEFDNLAEALHQAVNNPNAMRMPVVYEGTMPDLLQHEAQAILTGSLGEDGVFYATELLLKCPSRFEGEGEAPLGEDHPGMESLSNANAG